MENERTQSGRGLRGFLHSGVGIAAATVGFAASLLTALFLLVPGLQPGGGSGGSEERSARLRALQLVPKVTARQYLRETMRSLEGYDADQLGTVGNVVFVEVESRGLKNRPTPLVWSLYDAGAKTLVDDGRFIAQPLIELRAQTDVYRRVAEIWLPRPTFDGRFFGRVELLHSNDVLAFADTPEFRVETPVAVAPPPGPPPSPPPPGPPPPPPTGTIVSPPSRPPPLLRLPVLLKPAT